MIFNVSKKRDKFIEQIYKKSLDEVGKSFKIKWKYNKPRIIVWRNRKEIDEFLGRKTKNWLVGFADGRSIYILDYKNLEKESCHKFSKKYYTALLKHEFVHLFFDILSKGNNKPIWFDEGVSIYFSGQLKFKKMPLKFSKFLELYEGGEKGVYEESGFVVELLVKKFGKEKLLNLIKALGKSKSEKDFKKLFKQAYGFNINYTSINKLWKSKK